MSALKLRLEIELTYDAGLMHGNDKAAIDWFFNDILRRKPLTLHSDEIGDEVGSVVVLSVKAPSVEPKVTESDPASFNPNSAASEQQEGGET